MLRDMKFFLRPSDDVCCIAVSSDNHTCVTSTDVNNHATLGIVCGAQVPKCEPARVASRRNVWGTRCERSDVSCETLCRCACAPVHCVSKCVTKKQWQRAMRTRALGAWTNRRPSRGHPCGSVTVLMAVSTRGYSGGGLCERSQRAVVPRADTASPPWSHGSIVLYCASQSDCASRRACGRRGRHEGC